MENNDFNNEPSFDDIRNEGTNKTNLKHKIQFKSFFEIVPSDIWFLILHQLDLISLCRFCRVNKFCQTLGENPQK